MREQPAEPIAVAEMASFLEARDQLREGLASGVFAERESAVEGPARVAGLPAGSAGGN
jgi:hypothetical protein